MIKGYGAVRSACPLLPSVCRLPTRSFRPGRGASDVRAARVGPAQQVTTTVATAAPTRAPTTVSVGDSLAIRLSITVTV